MISDEIGRDLHDRLTRSEQLSDDQQRQLEHWYEHQDRLETNILGTSVEAKRIAKLRSQIEVALTQLTTISHRIQEIASENEILRQEISSLRPTC